MEAKQKSIGGLWSYTSKAGENYISGNIEIDGKKHRFVAFKNKYKKEEKHPDCQIYPERNKEIPASHPDIPDSDIPY